MILIDAPRQYKRQSYCHMVSDVSVADLHAFAKSAGIPRHWFHNAKFPHYDLNPINREKALTFNAKEVSSKEIVLAAKRMK